MEEVRDAAEHAVGAEAHDGQIQVRRKVVLGGRPVRRTPRHLKWAVAQMLHATRVPRALHEGRRACEAAREGRRTRRPAVSGSFPRLVVGSGPVALEKERAPKHLEALNHEALVHGEVVSKRLPFNARRGSVNGLLSRT